MKKNCIYILVTLLTVALTTVPAASAFAGGSAGKTNQYETVEGVLAIKEGHGEFLVRMPDGKAQRFSMRAGAGAVEITRNGQPVRYSELKVNDSIEVNYDPLNRKVIAIHARQTAEKTSQPQSSNYETVKGVLSIKEGHGDFLIRLSDGKAQRFRVRGNAAEITRNGKAARYNELKVSDSVQVKYDATNRKVIAIQASGS
jgi:uncharacterized protein YuzE